MSCDCEVPREDADPRYASCLQCGMPIDPRWTSNDETVREFLDLLGRLPDVETFAAFRRQCEERERAGRPAYGHRHLSQDSAREGMEEAADGAIYCHFALLRARRERREVPLHHALEAAYHFALAHQALIRLRAER